MDNLITGGNDTCFKLSICLYCSVNDPLSLFSTNNSLLTLGALGVSYDWLVLAHSWLVHHNSPSPRSWYCLFHDAQVNFAVCLPLRHSFHIFLQLSSWSKLIEKWFKIIKTRPRLQLNWVFSWYGNTLKFYCIFVSELIGINHTSGRLIWTTNHY